MVIDITLRIWCRTDITLISHLGLIHGDWYHWYHTTDLYMMTDITLISHFGLIHGDWYHWYHTTDTYMVKETAEQSGESPPTYPVSNISRDPSHCDWRIQLFGSRSSVTLREVPLQRHVGGSNCSTQQALGNPPFPQRLHQITWHGQSGDREGFWGTTEGFWGDDGPRGVVSPVVSPVFVEEVKYQGTNQ